MFLNRLRISCAPNQRRAIAFVAILACAACSSHPKNGDTPSDPPITATRESQPVEPKGINPAKHEALNPTIRLVGNNVASYFAAAIADLGDKDALLLTAVAARSGDNISSIVSRSYGTDALRVVGDFDLYLCRTNPNSCRVWPCANLTKKCKKHADTADWRSLVPGPENSDISAKLCALQARKAYIVCIPDLTVTVRDQGTSVVRRITPKDDITKIVVDNTGGCARWDDDCALSVVLSNNLNPAIMERIGLLPGAFPKPNSKFSSGSWWHELSGPIRLPARQVTVELHFRKLRTDGWQLTRDAVTHAVHKVGLWKIPQARNLPSLSAVSPGTPIGPDPLVSNAQDNPVPAPVAPPPVIPQTAAPTPANLDLLYNTDIRKAMNFQSADRFWKELASDEAEDARFSAYVGIWDKLWDESHCELAIGGLAVTRIGKRVGNVDDDEPHVLDNSVIGDSDPAPDDADAIASQVAVGDPNHPPPPPCVPLAAAPAAPQNFIDHATFIAGLIAGQPDKTGMSGINPSTRLWMYELSDGRLSKREDALSRISGYRIYKRTGFPRPFVVNLSQAPNSAAGDNGSIGALATIMLNRPETNSGNAEAAWINQVLFVISARDTGLEYDDATIAGGFIGLTANPALRQGILTVAGLSADGQHVLRCSDFRAAVSKNWTIPVSSSEPPACALNQNATLSDYGAAFDVAAAGISLGPLSNKRFGILAGASVAAPYVSGLASMLRARYQLAQSRMEKVRTGDDQRYKGQDYKDWIVMPVHISDSVRKRIMYTADPLQDGPALVAKFGRINFDRALDFEFDQITLAPGSGSEAVKHSCLDEHTGGYVLAADSKNDKPFSGPSEATAISIGNIRRVVREGPLTGHLALQSGFYVVYATAGGELSFVHDATFKPATTLQVTCIDRNSRDSISQPGTNLNMTLVPDDLIDLTRCSVFLKDCEDVRRP